MEWDTWYPLKGCETHSKEAGMAKNMGAIAGVVGAVVCIAASAAAQNQVFNGSFARDLRGWTQENYMVWSPVDANDSASSGSLLVVNTFQTNARGIEQCLAGPAIVPGNSYTFGGSIRIPSGQSTSGWAAVGLRWYDQPACGGSVLADQPRAQSEMGVADNEFHPVGWTGLAPAGAVSAQFVAYATKIEAGGVYVAHLDDLYFGPVGFTFAAPPAAYVPTGAHLVGYGGINWRTDLEVHNPTQQSVNYSIELLKRDQGNAAPLVMSDSLAAGASRRYLDIVFINFGFQGAAALRVEPASGAVAVTSRTYNQTDNGTYGQYVPGLPEYEAVVYGGEARLVQLTYDLSTTTGYRTNIGFLSAVNMPITIEVRLFDSSGALLGTLSYNLQPYEFKQIDKIFRNVTSNAVADGYAILRTTTPGGRFLAYAAVIDNATGDPICVQPALY
jgi:hypothetical protein